MAAQCAALRDQCARLNVFCAQLAKHLAQSHKTPPRKPRSTQPATSPSSAVFNPLAIPVSYLNSDTTCPAGSLARRLNSDTRDVA